MFFLFTVAAAHVPFHEGDWTITEFDPRPASEGGQWFEVRNNTGTTQNLVEQIFEDSDGTLLTVGIPVLIPSGSYAVIASVDSTVHANLRFASDFSLPPEAGSLLHSDIPGPIDAIAWDSSWNAASGLGVSPSLESLPWANDRASNWCSVFPSPGSQNPACPGDDQDDDGDGYAETAGDCDDQDPEVHPGVPDLPDGHDENCDGQTDDAGIDNDGDGFSEVAGDCDDQDPSIYPGAVDDSGDRNCDGQVDGANDTALDTAGDSAEPPDSGTVPKTSPKAPEEGCAGSASAFLVLGFLIRRKQ